MNPQTFHIFRHLVNNWKAYLRLCYTLTFLNLKHAFILRLVYDFRVIKGTVRSASSVTAQRVCVNPLLHDLFYYTVKVGVPYLGRYTVMG